MPFSPKQLKVLTWWLNPRYKDYETIICDGSVRSSKTLTMSISYLLYSMHYFNGVDFGFAGQSISALYRNVIDRLVMIFQARGYQIKDNRSQHVLTVSYGGKTNYYYLFGANNAKSADHVRGMTAGAFFFDEVAEMPESFVTVASQRCNYDRSTLWFNCNPSGPYNWFKRNWIDKPKQHRVLHIPFKMSDNPALSDHVINRYKRQYSGVAYQRDVLGKWVIASGLVYSNFNKKMIANQPLSSAVEKYIVSCDYGAQNPTTFLLWAFTGNRWYLVNEYFYDARHSAHNKSDAEYANDLDHWLNDWQAGLRPPIIVDPAAQNFVITLQEHGYNVLGANKDVLNGIRLVQIRMNQHKIMFTPNLPNVFREFESYIWDERAENRGVDRVVKAHDHCMDAIRYFVVDELPPSDLTSDSGVKFFNNY